MPTLLEFAGADLPESHRLDGQSLVPLLVNNMPLGHRTLFWGSGRDEAGAVRQSSWKLISDREGVKLYNLSDDVHESEDLAGRFPDRVDEMLKMLESWRQDVDAGATSQSDGEKLWARIKMRSLTLLRP
jgi:arylsulfatase A-like enzyme